MLSRTSPTLPTIDVPNLPVHVIPISQPVEHVQQRVPDTISNMRPQLSIFLAGRTGHADQFVKHGCTVVGNAGRKALINKSFTPKAHEIVTLQPKLLWLQPKLSDGKSLATDQIEIRSSMHLAKQQAKVHGHAVFVVPTGMNLQLNKHMTPKTGEWKLHESHKFKIFSTFVIEPNANFQDEHSLIQSIIELVRTMPLDAIEESGGRQSSMTYHANPQSNNKTSGSSSTRPTASSKQVSWDLGDHATNDDQPTIKKIDYKKKPKPPIEAHYDDCGDDLTGIAMPDDPIEKLVSKGYLTIVPGDCDSAQSNSSTDFDVTFDSFYLRGSDAMQDSLNPPGTCYFSTIDWAIALFQKVGRIDVAEIFGGEGGVIRICFKKGLSCGRNFDLSTNVDLNTQHGREVLLRYLKLFKPRVVSLAPPCTAFSSWSFFNQWRNYESWYERFKIGKALAELACLVAEIQLENKCDFLIENPLTSRIWQLPGFQ